MKVFVRTLTNQKFELEVNADILVHNFKEEIHKVHKLGEPDTQKLIYSGKILKDDQTLDDAKIKDGGFVVLMTKKPDTKKEKEKKEDSEVTTVHSVAPAAVVTPAVVNAAPAPVVVAPVEPVSPGADVEDDADDEEHHHHHDANDGDILEWLADAGDDDVQQAADLMNQVAGLIHHNPQLAGQLVEQLVQRYPELAPQLADPANVVQVLQQPQNMIRVLEIIGQLAEDEEGADGDGDDEQLVEFTEQEFAAIQRLEALGFDRNNVIQAYLICDKNEELAANYLFENVYNDGGDMDLDPHNF